MKRLCKDFRVINTGHGTVNIFQPGMVYDIKEFRGGEALVNGIWAPDYIFSPLSMHDLTFGEKGE